MNHKIKDLNLKNKSFFLKYFYEDDLKKFNRLKIFSWNITKTSLI